MTAPHWRPAYIGVGSNLGSPAQQVRDGIADLASIANSILVLQSGLYRTAPMGPAEQPDYINAVAAMLTQLAPHELLSELHKIEIRHGRVREGERWGPRTLDLDLLSFADVILGDEILTLPHPGVAARNFVLLPWCEIAPHYLVPGLASVAELAASSTIINSEIEKLAE